MNGKRDLSTAAVIVTALAHLVDIELDAATLRQWVRRGHIQRHGTTHRGAALYDPREVLEHAWRRSACPRSEDVSQ